MSIEINVMSICCTFNSISSKDSIFGNLLTNDVEIIDESRLEGALSFEIKDFSKIRYTSSKDTIIDVKTRFVDQWFLVNNIPWIIGVELNENDYDIYLEILCKPLDQTKQFLESNRIKTEISIEIIKLNEDLCYQKIFSVEFDSSRYIRLSKIISLKDIMKPSNTLYNEITDSLKFEARIKIIQ